ncbi:hypothetical protein B0A55_12013 [Friedmanniomyces simplex]|uniref:Apple domain-containing protein n=1 Tax=Friedmanniomyces simplex TaxID=329884 RepID=A0A4U0WG94_9PEZI|nr:hypothetical protein B0A55_12013 [Friedmanniomyces simplex]
MQDYAGNSYAVTCDSFIASTDQYAAASGVINTTYQCLEACDELTGCLGVYFLPVTDAVCTLITGAIVGVEPQEGYNAYVRQGAPNATAPASSSGTNVISILASISASISKSVASSVSTSYYQPTSISNVSSVAAPAKCPASNITCPACDGEKVIDDRGNAYKVFCDNQLYADSDYNVQQWLSPDGCLAECDNYSWCKGSTFRPEGNCQLAKGENVFPQEMQGYTAFLPVPNSTVVAAAAPHAPSAYPTVNGYSAVAASPPSTFATVTSSPTQPSSTPPPTSPCNLDIARCPACDGANVTDWLNQTYTISCNEIPICGLVVNRANYTLQFECLEYCDADPVCFAAMWETGRCDLCQETLEGKALQVQAGPADYVYYYPVSQGVVASKTASSTRSSGAMALSTSNMGGASTVSSPLATPTVQVITGTLTSLPTAPQATATSVKTSLSVPQVQQDTFITAPAPSSTATMIEITGTVTNLGGAASVTSGAPTTSSVSFVPPLTDGSVSLATPGGQTRRV